MIRGCIRGSEQSKAIEFGRDSALKVKTRIFVYTYDYCYWMFSACLVPAEAPHSRTGRLGQMSDDGVASYR